MTAKEFLNSFIISAVARAIAQDSPVERRFKQRDKNTDTKFGHDELPGALFNRFDANRDGFVTGEELKALWGGR